MTVTESGNETVRVPSGATPLSPVVSSDGTKVLNNVAHILVAGPTVVSVVVAVCVTVLAGLGRLTPSDVVAVLGGVLATHTAASSVQSLKRSG